MPTNPPRFPFGFFCTPKRNETKKRAPPKSLPTRAPPLIPGTAGLLFVPAFMHTTPHEPSGSWTSAALETSGETGPTSHVVQNRFSGKISSDNCYSYRLEYFAKVAFTDRLKVENKTSRLLSKKERAVT